MARYNIEKADSTRLTRLLDLALEDDALQAETAEHPLLGGEESESPLPRIPDHTLIKRVGRGSYGEVWLAQNIMGEFRAVKIVHRSDFTSDGPFERELAGIRQFEPVSRTHESHLDILHLGRTQGAFYYVMEAADDLETGPIIHPDAYQPRTLRSEARRAVKMSAEDCLKIGLPLAEALHELHLAGLVHRDIKPANIVFVRGRPKLADIGLVTDLDATATFVGTEGFVPPEGPGSPQADVYSLGKVLYELLTGEDRKRHPEWPPSAVVSEEEQELRTVIDRACERDQRRRYSSAEALLQDLQLLERHESVRDRRRMERNLRWLRKLGVAATVVVALALGAFGYQRSQTREKERLAELAETEANRSRQALLELAEDTAIKAMEDQRSDDALLWTARALDLVEPGSRAEQRQVQRANMIYRNTPRMVRRFDLSHAPWLAEQLGEFLPSRAHLVVPGTNSVRILNLDENRWTHELNTGKDSLPVALYAPGTESWLITVSAGSNTIRVWDTMTGQQIGAPLEGARFEEKPTPLDIQIDPNTGILIALQWMMEPVAGASISGGRPRLSAWDIQTGQRLWDYDEGYQWQQSQIQDFALDAARQRVLVNFASLDPSKTELISLNLLSGPVVREPLMIQWPLVDLMAWHAVSRKLLYLAREGSLAEIDLDSDATRHLHHAEIDPTFRHLVSWRSKLGEIHVLSNPVNAQLAVAHQRFIELINPEKPNQPAIRLSHEPHAFGEDRLVPDAFAFSPDGLQFAAATDDGLLCIWNTATGEQAYEPLSHSSRLHRVRFSHDSRYVMAVDKNKQLMVWNLNPSIRSKDTLSFPDFPGDIDLQPSSDLVAIALMGRSGKSNQVSLVDLETTKVLATRQFTRSQTPPRVQFSPSGKWLAIATSNEVHLVNPAELDVSQGVLRHETNVWIMAFGPDEKILATAEDRSHQVNIWAIDDTSNPQQSIAVSSAPRPYSEHGVTHVRLRREGDHLHLHSLYYDKQYIHCLEKDRFVGTIDGNSTGYGMDMELSRDRRFSVKSSGDEVRVANVGTERIAQTVVRLEEHASTAAISPDNKTVAVGTVTGSLMLFSVGAPKPDLPIQLNPADALWADSHAQQITDLVFSEDGSFLVSGSLDGTARLWDVDTGKPLSNFLKHSGGLFEVILTADGSRLITATREGVSYEQGAVVFWDLSALSTNTAFWKDVALVQNGGLLRSDGTFQKASNEAVIEALDRVNEQSEPSREFSNETRIQWHEQLAETAQACRHLEAERFHLQELLTLNPVHESARLRLSEIDALSNPFPPRDPSTPDHLLDLTDFYRIRLDQDWETEAYRGNNLAEVPSGYQIFAGTPFDVRGVVVLGSGNVTKDAPNRVLPVFPESVRNIPVERKTSRIHFLHGAGGYEAPGSSRIGSYSILYQDGSRMEIPIVKERNVAGWWNEPKDAPDAQVAWQGKNALVRERGTEIAIYKFTWDNPLPDLDVASIDFETEGKLPSPWLLGITVDPVE